MNDPDNNKKKLPFVVEFLKFSSGFVALVAAALLVLRVAS
jgi:hypothetical protein